jgi:DNA repair exonuclease SbcCD ATPase subunit
MSATITSLPSRSSESSGEVGELHNQKATAQSLEAGSERDNFIAETAVKIDRLQETNRLLVSDVAELVVKVTSLQEACALEDRWYGFHQAEKRVGESKLDEMARCWRDLKARLDKIETRAAGNYHAYQNFAEVSRKLGELEHSREEAKQIGRKAAFRAWLFCGTLLAAAAIMGLSIALAGGHS